MPRTTRQDGDDEKRLGAAAESCTRSGAFALLVSLALLGLVPSWTLATYEREAYRYYTFRLRLDFAVDNLRGSVGWRSYVDDHPGAEDQTLEELSKAEYQSPSRKTLDRLANITAPSASTSKAVQPVPRSTPPPPRVVALPASGPVALLTPQNLVISGPIQEVTAVIENLLALDDPKLLENAKKGSNSRALSIARWQAKRNELVLQAIERRVGSSGAVFVTSSAQGASSSEAGSIGRTDLLSLRLRDVAALAQANMPTLMPPSIRDSTLEADVAAPGSLPKSLDGATMALEALLFVTLVYLAVLLNYAVGLRGFPFAGTLFSAFAAGPIPKMVLVGFLLIPAFATVTVAVASKLWWLWGLAAISSAPAFWALHLLTVARFFDDTLAPPLPRKLLRP